LSERHFCSDCDKTFQEGEKASAAVEQRAAELEKAKEAEDYDTVAKIAGEIAVEGAKSAVTQPDPPIAMQPTATVEAIKE
jgi:hypothetical protein